MYHDLIQAVHIFAANCKMLYYYGILKSEY